MTRTRWLIVLALVAGLALRLFFVLAFPASDDDSAAYLELAHNLVDHHTYGLYLNGVLTPVTYRMPGYPLFLAAVYAVGGKSVTAARLAQVAVDLCTCGLIALLAWTIAPRGVKGRVGIVALWLSALCPFVANYCAVVLSEVLATFWTAAALVAIAWAMGAETPIPKWNNAKRLKWRWWLIGGLCVGAGATMRPETPILLVAAGIGILTIWWRPRDWGKAVAASALLCAGVGGVLAPWAIRNWVVLGQFQPLVPRYIHLPGESTTPGFIAWSQTWLVRYSELDDVLYKVGREPIRMEDIPSRAFDSPQERERLTALIEEQNPDLSISPSLDAKFAVLARERERAHPLRTHLWIPLRRIGTIWLTPRVELLPVSADLWPPWERAADDPVEFSVALGLWLVQVFLIVIAVLAWYRCWRNPVCVFLGSFLMIRTLFFGAVHFTPEPRFVLECLPVVLALGAMAIVCSHCSTKAHAEGFPT